MCLSYMNVSQFADAKLSFGEDVDIILMCLTYINVSSKRALMCLKYINVSSKLARKSDLDVPV